MDKKKILVVDDEEPFVKVIKLNLEKTGQFEARAQYKGSTCLDAVREFMPDLILLDILMPDLSGTEVAGQLRKDDKLKNIPILYLTALAAKDKPNVYGGIVNGMPFYAQPVIGKPVKTGNLVERIEENLKKKELFNRNPACKRCQKKIDCVNDADLKDQDLVHFDCERAGRQQA